MLKKLWEAIRPNPFDELLKKARRNSQSRFLIVWNRGLGDIPLGLFALVYRIRSFIPHASITFLTREDLRSGFEMLENVNILVGSTWKRGESTNLEETLKEHQLRPDLFDLILENPNPTKWFKWQLGTLTPKLVWHKKWDQLSKKYEFSKEETYIGVHVNTETGEYYGYEKNWPLTSWQELFSQIQEKQKVKLILFGMNKEPAFLMDHIIDLRGQTSVFEMLSVIKNYCAHLIAPDSGVLSLIYYVADSFPIQVTSLWADPRQGVLRQKVPSPNPQFKHIPLIGKGDSAANISVKTVYETLFP